MTNSPLVQYITNKQSGTSRMTTTKAYDSLNRLTVISSVNSLTTVDAHNYGYNLANQRTAVTNADGTYWQYQYDSLGQVTSGIKHWSDGSVVAGQQFGYGFDDIGNRQTTSAGGDQWGANLRYASYTANNLNQYTSRTVPGAVDVIGSATNTATVTVNNQPTYRRGNYFRAQLSLTNLSSPVWQPITNLAVLNEGTTDVRLSAQTNNLFLPKTPETFSYDADGNLTNDGRWAYIWDAENRLISMTNITGVPSGAQMRIDFGYDHRSRRTSKNVVIAGVTNAQKFVYDGWNAQATLNSSFAALNTFMWGSDLSGSPQGAGGVGGLLKVSSGTTNCFVAYDGNGNVSVLVNAADGTVLAQYEYGPFGEVIRATGPMAKLNPFRFSTKYQDDESDLVYYGYRFYNANTGRWPSRDPIGEMGGINIYGFVQNNALFSIDCLGLEFGFPLPKFWPTKPSTSCKSASSTFVAKSFINGLPNIGNLDRYGVGSISLIPSQWRLDMFAYLSESLDAFNQNPYDDAKDGRYRLYTKVAISATCCCGKISNVSLNTDADGGAETLGLSETINISSDITYGQASAAVHWKGWGRPNLLLEPGLQMVGFRGSVNIWHEVTVLVTCTSHGPVFSLQNTSNSSFPSFRLYQDGNQIKNVDQSSFSDLWGNGVMDSDFVPQ